MAEQETHLVDASDWYDTLRARLKRLDRAYREAEKAGDWPAQQNLASGALATVVSRLIQMPGMTGHLRPLEALMLAYEGLRSGSSHPLLDNHVSTVGGRELLDAQKILQGRSVAAVEILLASGWTEKDASKRATAILAHAGVKGTRRKGPLTVSALKAWRFNANSGSYSEVREYADEAFSMLSEAFRTKHGRWPPTKAEGEELVAVITRTQHFKDLASSASPRHRHCWRPLQRVK